MRSAEALPATRPGLSRSAIAGIIAALVLIFFCLCCGTLLVGGELYAGWALTATASVPTPTPSPTDTPTPTSTPTHTPVPTPTPSLTPTPSPLGHLSLEEQAYILAFQEQTQRWDQSRQNYEALMGRPSPSDPAWRNEILAQFSAWKQLAGQANSLVAPPRLQAAHQKYLTAARHFDLAADLATEGINNQDVVSFDQAKSEIAAGDAALAEAKAQVGEIARKP